MKTDDTEIHAHWDADFWPVPEGVWIELRVHGSLDLKRMISLAIEEILEGEAGDAT